MRAKRKPQAPPAPEFPIVVESFVTPDLWVRRQLVQPEPSCFNGMVRFRRYRVTFEEIDEPREVLGQRLLALWRGTNNHHNWEPLRKAAESIGYAFNGYMEKATLIDRKEAP